MLDRDFYEPAGPIQKYVLTLHYYDLETKFELKKKFESNTPFPRISVGDDISWDPEETFITGKAEYVFHKFHKNGTVYEVDVRLRP
jgi:hypothetical protein